MDFPKNVKRACLFIMDLGRTQKKEQAENVFTVFSIGWMIAVIIASLSAT